jgi:hypothetical protein
MTMGTMRLSNDAVRTRSAPADGRRRDEDRFDCLAAACGVVAMGSGGARSATVQLGLGPADAVLAPERLAELEGRFHVYLDVLDRGSALTEACVCITRPSDAGPTATRFAAAAGRLVDRLTGRARRSPRG